MDIESYKLLTMEDYKKLMNKNYGLSTENKLLKEELTNLKNDITRVYNTMISLEVINEKELEDIDII